METLPYNTPGAALPFRNATGQILAVGIVLILFGVVSGCFTAAAPMALMVPQQPGQVAMPKSQIALGVAIYLFLTILFIWLGIGGVQRRRWFRPLTMILSAHWLVIGVGTTISSAFMIPVMRDMMAQTTSGAISPQALTAILIGSLVFIVAIGIVVPAAFLLMLRSDDVRMTLGHFDPMQRWTDGVPIKILGLSLTLLVAGLLYASAAVYAVFPFFGVLLTGWPAIVLPILLGAALGAAGYQVFKLQMSGWWIGMAAIIGSIAAALPTIIRVPLDEYYRKLGTPPEQIDMMMNHESLLRTMMILFCVLFAVSFAIYMLKMRPLLRAAAAEARTNPVVGVTTS